MNTSREEFFFRHNYIIMVGGLAIAFSICLFWSVYNFATNDSLCFLETKAEVFILTCMVASAVAMIIFRNINLNSILMSKDIRMARICAIIYFAILLTTISTITGAGCAFSLEQGSGPNMLTISLSSTLMFIPVFAPLPKKRDGVILFCIAFVTMFVPYLMVGHENYVLLQEIVLRVCMIVAYIVILQKVNRSYDLEQINLNANKNLEESGEEVIDLLINAVEIRDVGSGEHIKKVRGVTRVIAEEIRDCCPEYDLSASDIETIVRASGMHDIGKIMIPDEILLKPGSLTKEEFEIMKTHSQKGFEMLEHAPHTWGESLIKFSQDICLYHHEKYDGGGYPFGLVGDDIPIWAQIVSVADCFEALTSLRSYQEPFPAEKALDMILNNECGVFSDKIRACLMTRKEDLINLVTA